MSKHLTAHGTLKVSLAANSLVGYSDDTRARRANESAASGSTSGKFWGRH